MTNRRTQRRLGTKTTTIGVTVPGQSRAIEVEIHNLSWGGAFFIASDPAVCQCERMRLTFPWLEDQTFSAEADMMRCEQLADGRFAVAVRFYCIASNDQMRLTRLLKLLISKEDRTGPDSTIPIAETLDLTVTDDDEMRERLQQIGSGRLSLTVFGAYALDQSLSLNLSGSQRYPDLYLRARVTGQEIISIPFTNQPELVKLELSFEHPEEDLHKIAGLLNR
ncbi:PilZ domain-containing protein [Imhoffiella purpurea]|uniref:PilZ domain-containing protein n=1 Tax=Imhoffiella purpurea TaxID=1249627 RepID=W9VGR1_9GAMM|nr:PilZ domain-containing protein [Imhoffiella purpurea]EXJ15232.1 hypothetical protein D779_1530 [Imhoffiella purpurea]